MLNGKMNLSIVFVLTVGSFCLASVSVDFDNFQLKSNSHWGGAGSGQTPLKTKGVSLPYTEDEWSWSGFAYSNETDTTTNSFTNQFSAVTGADVSGTGNYGIGAFSMKWWDDYSIDPLKISLHPGTTSHDCLVTGAYFTNTTYTYLTMRDGDTWGFADPFGGADGTEEDYLKLIIRGIDGSGNYADSTVEFYLGDYRSADDSLDYLVDEWTWVDLSGLGAVSELEFSLQGSDVGMFGLNTPAYFALDELTIARGYGQMAEITNEIVDKSEFSMASVAFVPEPATAALLAMGGVLLRRKKSM